jgi:hypothetical protein
MRLPVSLLLLVLTLNPSLSSAGTASHIIRRLHDTALRHSAGLARDLRVAFHPILIPRSVNSSSQGAVYCIAATKANSSISNNAKPGKGGGTGTSKAPAPTQTSPWTLIESHQGQNFFDGWDFFTGSDPTHGTVEYIDQNTGVCELASSTFFEIDSWVHS